MFKSKKEPISIVLFELVKVMNWKITYSTIDDKLLQHPSYPSMFSITNTLSDLGIDNKAVKITAEQLKQLDTPFLAHTNSEEIVLVTSVTDSTIHYFHPSNGYRENSMINFKKLWSPLVVLVDTNAKIEEKNYKKKKHRERLLWSRAPILITAFVPVMAILGYCAGPGILSLLLLLKVLGLVVSILLVTKEINKDTEYRFCKTGKKINCNDVLNSPAAKIFDWLSMTDLGFLYFMGTFLALSFVVPLSGEIARTILVCLGLLSLMGLPYTIFSLVYQAFKIKKWCSLCLAIIFALWAEAILGMIAFVRNNDTLPYRGDGLLIFVLCLLTPAVIWLFLKRILIRSSNYKGLLYSYLRITNNLEVFQFLQLKGTFFEMDIRSNDILLGNPNAPNKLVVAMNPFCPACGREYKFILKLLDEHPDFATVIIRFVGNPYVKDDAKFFASCLLINQFITSKNNFKEILKEWYETRNHNSFIKKYVLETNELVLSILENNYIWSEKTMITITPTTFFNNVKLSERYTIERLNVLLNMNNE
ncbi:vitamin K epoxide reductase family protein [Maribacter sp. 2304DJ31-5]|uniref:vitamin K epoxide reductase family protein n=1 Tax=Maribacter sp. 2304DJ31-5 TaxID=3386273 RepID=UPI0039BD3278